jgi:hypothetical protein
MLFLAETQITEKVSDSNKSDNAIEIQQGLKLEMDDV